MYVQYGTCCVFGIYSTFSARHLVHSQAAKLFSFLVDDNRRALILFIESKVLSDETVMPSNSDLQSLKFSGTDKPTLSVLDQLLIPQEKVYIDIPDVEAAWGVIRSMQIRGAPLIAIVALLGLTVDLNSNEKTIAELERVKDDGNAVMKIIDTKLDYLATARPTAVNVFNAIAELRSILQETRSKTNDSTSIKDLLCKTVLKHTEFMLERDVQDNKAIGKFGAEAILKERTDKVNIMTICNTGSLATAGYGTALGVVRALQEMDKLESITALETRPYNQGSRLTAFEIVEEKMPGGTLICDSAAAALMRVCKIIDFAFFFSANSLSTYYR